ncbi:MAG: hypothetical protein QOE65_770 [Solirubrobacteraceae bacterium]|nr:hypothetical protein [Solirubrobacteraceae bacterium]
MRVRTYGFPGCFTRPPGTSARDHPHEPTTSKPVVPRGYVVAYSRGMCRNIRTLYNFEPTASDEEVRAAATQYVRKISGFTKPSQANAEAFERAIDEIAHASHHLLAELETTAPPKDRETEAAKARARSAKRFATA